MRQTDAYTFIVQSTSILNCYNILSVKQVDPCGFLLKRFRLIKITEKITQ